MEMVATYQKGRKVMEDKYEKLKKQLFIWGKDRIEEFLGYSDNITGLSKDAIENLMDETYSQMPDDVLEEFYQKYLIDYGGMHHIDSKRKVT